MPVLFSTFEMLRNGWMNQVRNFWGENNIFPPWFSEMRFASDHSKKGKGHCVRGHGIERVGRDFATLVKQKTQDLL